MTRLLLGELAPAPGASLENVERIRGALRAAPCDLAIFPELFLSGYRVGDRFHHLALRDEDAVWTALREAARESGSTIVVGAPLVSSGRKGELQNAALLVPPEGPVAVQVKRYLPTFGPFEEGIPFTPTDVSVPLAFGSHHLGLSICYDTFFPEVSRDLALGGADLLVVISASPTTSGALFEKLLPARAVENGLPVVYVNRVGVEDGVVFGGGSGAWDPRGEPVPVSSVSAEALTSDERLLRVDVDLDEPGRWRPFRPVLRDAASRPGPARD